MSLPLLVMLLISRLICKDYNLISISEQFNAVSISRENLIQHKNTVTEFPNEVQMWDV